MPSTLSTYPAEYFTRQDTTDDSFFYQQPRFVTHIDDAAIAALSSLYAELLPTDGAILDLMSSWVSHLPANYKASRVAGLGMNKQELEANPVLTEHLVHNLNQLPMLPYEDGVFDAALCAVSVQYLISPIEVFSEVRRTLKPGGVFIVSFSNRCFPTKAISAWNYSGVNDHVTLVNSYFSFARFTDMKARIKNTPNSDPLIMLWGYNNPPIDVDAVG